MTSSHIPTPHKRLRLHPLAACLAAALMMQAGAAVVAAPRGSLAVSTCDDAGSGSLRDVVATAASGDVIDLTGLGCPSITLSSGAIVIAASVDSLTIQGPDAAVLTLSGNDNDRIFEHQGSGTLTLSGLSLTHGRASDSGGCILADGNLALIDVTVIACAAGAPDVAGNSGGAAAVLGNVTLDNTRFTDNTLDGTLRVRGGALAAGGSFTATTSVFSGNHATSHAVDGSSPFDNIVEGGAIHALGDAELTDSTVSGNTASSDTYEVFGGGINVGSHVDNVVASLDLLRSTVSDNSASSTCDVCAPQGGGIAANGITALRQATLTGNTVGSTNHYGGGGGLRVFHAPSVEISRSTISANHADSAGGGLIAAEQGVLSIDASTIADNFAGNQGSTDEGGGGVLCLGCSVQLSSSTVSGNVAEYAGAGVAIRYGDYAPAPSTIIDSTISGNSSGDEGGGLFLDGSETHISNSTIAFNQAASRGAGISATEYTYQLELQSTLVSNNLTAGDANNVWAFPDTVSGANNLVPNAPGLPGEMPDDTLVGDPLLQPLADNGGATQTHALGVGSPAIDAGNDAIGLVFDQRGDGFPREVGAVADIGAFEQQAAADPDLIFKTGFEAP
jgi:hypothetical protein